jgi:hypothetical protein
MVAERDDVPVMKFLRLFINETAVDFSAVG